jgi:hypothetical protein
MAEDGLLGCIHELIGIAVVVQIVLPTADFMLRAPKPRADSGAVS